jgi:molybdate transport system substrate-binding protein
MTFALGNISLHISLINYQFYWRPSGERVKKRSNMAGILRLSVAMAVVSGLAGVVATGEPVQAETLTIGAAHSLKAAFQEIVPMFEKEYGAKVGVVYGPSHTLRRQIEKGAAIDVFLPAAVEDVDKLHKKGLTLNGGPRIYAHSSLVLVMSASSRATPISFHEVLNPATRLAVADPKVSTLGEITARALTKLDPAYKNRFHLLQAQHSEDVVNLVHTGQAHVGLVYRADAINNGLRIIDESPTGTYTPVQFGEAVVWTCRKASLGVAEEFLDFMMSPRIQKLLLKYGFDPAPSNG